VAGFNQFYDDLSSTISRRYGAAVDQTFSSNLYGGLEVSKRDMDVPVMGSTTDWLQELQRAYLFWTPKSWLGLKIDYQFEHLYRNFFSVDGLRDADTHRLVLGMKIFHPSGWSFSLDPTYYDQKGTFESVTSPGVLMNGKDSFWLVNATISYRLPKRHGVISAGAKNMFKKDFMYFDTNYNNPTLQPGRTFFVSATVALP